MINFNKAEVNNTIKVKKLHKPRNKQSLFQFAGLDGKQYNLSLKQKIFSERYLELLGNGTQAVIVSGYDVHSQNGRVNINLAGAIASENLRKPNIYAYINLLLDKYGYSDNNVEKQHLFLINQFDNFNAKAKGIDMYYKVKGKYAPERHEHRYLEFEHFSRDELLAAAGFAVIDNA